MSWRYAAVVGNSWGEWEGTFNRSNQAREVAEIYYDDFYVAFVEELSYVEQLPGPSYLLAEMAERAAEKGANVSCFDELSESDLEDLNAAIRSAVAQWEEQLEGDKRSSVVVVSNVTRHKARR